MCTLHVRLPLGQVCDHETTEQMITTLTHVVFQEKLGRGEFSRSSSVRVLHLRMNPESELHKQVWTCWWCVAAYAVPPAAT